jgi:hypothetical protein
MLIHIFVVILLFTITSTFGREVSFASYAGHLRRLLDGHANATWSTTTTASITTTSGQFQSGSSGELRLPTLAQFDFGSIVPEPSQTVRSLAVELSVRQRGTITGFLLIDRVQFVSASRALPLALVTRNASRAYFAAASPLAIPLSELDCWVIRSSSACPNGECPISCARAAVAVVVDTSAACLSRRWG